MGTTERVMSTVSSGKMHAIQVGQTGGPEVLEYVEIDVPEPGLGEVAIQVGAAGVNFIDIYHRQGVYPMPLPFVPGQGGRRPGDRRRTRGRRCRGGRSGGLAADPGVLRRGGRRAGGQADPGARCDVRRAGGGAGPAGFDRTEPGHRRLPHRVRRHGAHSRGRRGSGVAAHPDRQAQGRQGDHHRVHAGQGHPVPSGRRRRGADRIRRIRRQGKGSHRRPGCRGGVRRSR